MDKFYCVAFHCTIFFKHLRLYNTQQLLTGFEKGNAPR